MTSLFEDSDPGLRAGPIDTGEDLIEWVDESAGKGLGLAQVAPAFSRQGARYPRFR